MTDFNTKHPYKYRFDKWSDNDLDKEANYYVLKYTNMPAILLEMFFFDSYVDAIKMNDSTYRQKIALAIDSRFNINLNLSIMSSSEL